MNTNKPVSREPSSTSQPLRKAALALPLIAMAGAFAAPASMSRSASHSSSRRLARGATIVVADQALQIDAAASEQDEMPRSAFDAFRRGQTSGRALDNTGATLSENTLSDDAGILAFLQQNQRLESQPKAAAALSGALLGRKYFASDSPFDHCHFTWGSVYYTNTYTSLNQASCEISWGGTWHTGVSAPVVMATSILNKTSSSFDVSVSMSESATVYAVLVESNKTAPTPAQVIAGTDGDNNAALQTTSGAAANSTTLSFSGLDASKYYLVYLAAVDGSSEVTSASTQVNPAYETGLISADGTWKFPKIRVDDSGNYYLGYSKDGSSGDDITFLLWNGAGFSNYTSFNASAISGRAYVSWGNEQRVDYDFDSNGHIHAVFSATETNYANTGDPFYGYYNGSSWSFTKIAETGNSVDEVDVFVDANDDVHVSWKVYNGSGYQVDYATNKSGSWVKTNVVVAGNGTDEAHDTYVVADSSGTATVFYRREDSQNNGEDNYYMESSSDGFSASTKILNGKGDAKVYRMANVLIDSSNKIHYAYSDQTGGASYYVTNASGGWVSTAITHAGHSTPWVYGMEYDNGVYYFANYGDSKYFINSYNGSDWVDGFDFELDGWMNDRFAVNSTADRIMLVSENSSDWEIHYHTGTIAGYVTPTSPADSDGNLTSAAGVTEPVGLDTTVDSVGEAVDLFDFTLSDGASSDGLAMEISQLVVNVSGTSSDAERANVTWRLNGADASNVTGVYSSANDTITFSGLSLSIADGGSEIYTINGYYNDNTGLTEDHTMILSMDGDTDVTISGGTSMGATSAVSNSSGTTVDVTATGLRLTTQAAGLVSGMAMTTQPVVAAEDAFGNIDSDFTEVVTGSDEGISPGNVLTNNSVTAVAGVATFTSLTNTTATDGQALIVTFNDQDGIGSNLTTVNTNLLFTDVVATQLQLTTQPAPLTVSSGEAKSLTTVPVVKAVDANGYVDTGYSSDIRLAEVNGAGSALMTTTGDTDGSAATVSLTPSSGVATFTALQITYTTSGSSSETFNLQASSGSLTTTTSSQLTATNVPTLTDAHISISGASGTGGTYVIGDTISASWNNTSSGDNNTGVSAVTVDFSPFGGGAAISASESAGSWIATYTLTAGAIDSSNRNVSVTATNSSGHATAADTTNASVDNIAPIVTDTNLSISGASGIGGAFRAGDTVTARWNNTAGGDNNSDTISSVSVNFSAFGGAAAVVASNSAGSWSATYTLVSGAIDSSNRNISLTAIDNAGNSTTSADSTNATVDNMAPTITDGHLSISGASGSGGVFIAGDTLTARWNNTTAGDNNSDTISSVTMNFVAFGGGSAVVASNNSGIWSASYSITSSSTDGTLLNISATATDNAGNNASATDSSNATVDTSAPSGHSVAFDDSLIGSGEYSAVSFTFASAEVAGNYSYSISSSGGGTAVTGSGTVSSAAEQVSGIDLSGLNDGTLTLSVILTDVAGNSATAVTDTSTLDTTAPVLTEVSAATSLGNDTTPALTFSTNEAGTLAVGGSCGSASEGAVSSGNQTISLSQPDNSSALAEGSYNDCTLTVTDAADNASSALSLSGFEIDLTGPSGHSISFDDSLINSTEASSISVTMASAEVGAAYRYSISSSGGGTAVTGSGTVTSASEPLTAIDVSGLADGTLTVSLSLTDSADNAASAVTATSTLDTSAPSGHSVAFDDSLIGSGEYSAVSFTFASAEVAGNYSYSISSSGGGTAVTGSGTVSSAAEQVSGIDLSGLNDGTLTLSVILTDVAGNSATAVTDTSTLDVADPVLSSSTPADDATRVQYNSRIVLTLSEAVSATTGNFQLYDADGDTLVEAIAVGSGQVVISATQVTITPAANWTPTHRYYLLADSGLLVDAALNGWAGLSVASELNFTVANNNPTGGADSGSTQEDTAVDINVLANDGDVDSTLNAASVTVTHAPAHGSASVNTANGVITYTPLADFNGVDSFTYAVDDIYSGSSGDITVSITVAAVNDAPVAVADVATTAEDTAVTINVANNDTDVDNSDNVDTTTLTIVRAAAEGSASVVSGQIEYTPAADFNGSDSLTYQIKDQHGATSNVATLIINVSGVNDAPVAADDTGSTAEDTELVIDVIGNDTDIDGTLDSSKVTVVSSPAHGTITVDASSGEITYRPAADFNGSDSFTYVVKDDSDATSNVATVSLTITAVNDAPVASNDNVTLLEDASLNINALGNDSDVDGSIQAATLVLVEPPAQGIASVLSGVINYTPDADFNGADSLSYRVQDDSGAWSNTATVVMTITAVNDEPLANNDSASTSEDSAVVIDVAANDSDIDGSLDLSSIVVVTDVSHGTLVDNADGSLTYTPDSDYYGSDSFTYQLSDNEAGTSAVASVSLSVAAVNDAPLLSGTPASSVLEGSTFSFTPTVVDSDSSSFNFTLSGAPAWLVINSTTGKLTGTPAVGDEGSYSGIVMTADDRGTVNPTGSLPAFSLIVIGDNDSDGIANADDSDDDNDGMSDDYETRYGFDPFDDSDALADSDGDTIPNGQEQQDGTDPSNSSDYLDTTPPVITPPADAIVDATGVFTRVSVADLLGVSDTSAALAAMTSDNVDGPGCCNTSVLGLKGGSLRMRPGIHTVTYSATDAKGNTSTTTQTLRVRPLVSFSRDIASVEGGNVEVDVVLNGSAPDYPFEVPYRIDSTSSTADSADHNLSAGSVIFTADSTEARISFQLTDDGISEGAEILVLALDDDTTESDDLGGGYDPRAPDIHDINAGASHRVTITIGEQNLAPAASMVLQQGGSNTVLVARDGGMVTATVRVTDANLQDTHRFDWASSHSALVDTDGSLTNTTLVFDPSGLSSGRYNVQVRVDDSQGAADIARIYFRVEASAPVLSGSDDSDGDGIVDADEGTADSDDDGIPDYLDNIAQSNLLPETASETDGFLVECDPGVLCRLGQFAIMGSSGGARLSDDDVAAQQDLGADDDFEPKGGVFDFEIHDLPTMGQSVSIVVPQTQQIPANAVYRKFQNGRWNSFVSDTNNHIYSSAGSLGYCPPPGDSSWVAGLTEGDFCVQLTIEDGGPNDADNEVNGAVEDPGAVSILRADQTQTLADISTRADRSGGSLGGLGLLLLAAVASCGYRRRPGTHRSALPAVILPLAGVLGLALLMPTATVEAATPASEYDSHWLEDLGLDKDKGYVTIGLYRAHSSQSGGELQSQLQTDGLDATVTDYDAKRTAFDMGIGYRYLPGYAAEIRYLDMGAASTDLSANAAPNDLKTSLRRHHPVGGSGIVLSQRFSDAINNQLTLSFELGLYRWSGEVDTRRDDLNSHLDSGTAPMGGLGLDYQLNTEVGIGIRYQRFLFDRQQLDLAGASVQIGF